MATRRCEYTKIEQKEDGQQVELECITNDQHHVIDVHDGDKNANDDNIDNGMNLKCLDGFKTTKHVKCWLLTIMLWILIMSQTTYNTFNPYIFMCLFGICYLLYIADIYYSSSYNYIWSQHKIKNNDAAKQYIHNIKNAKVTMCWKGEWYHSVEEGYNITYTVSGRFQYASCINKTDWNLPQIIDKLPSKYGIIRMSFALKAEFANQITANEHNNQFEKFQKNFINLKADRLCRFQQYVEIKHLSKQISLKKCIYIENKEWNKPTNLNICCYLLAALLLILPCYRMWITTLIGNNKYQHKKCNLIKVFNSCYDTELLVHAFFGCVYYSDIKEKRVEYLPNSLAKHIAKFCPKLMISVE